MLSFIILINNSTIILQSLMFYYNLSLLTTNYSAINSAVSFHKIAPLIIHKLETMIMKRGINVKATDLHSLFPPSSSQSFRISNSLLSI